MGEISTIEDSIFQTAIGKSAFGKKLQSVIAQSPSREKGQTLSDQLQLRLKLQEWAGEAGNG